MFSVSTISNIKPTFDHFNFATHMSCALSMFLSICLPVFLPSLFRLLVVITIDSFRLVQMFNKGHSHLENVLDFQCLIQEAQGCLIELVWGPNYQSYCSGVGAGQGESLKIWINHIFIYNVNKSKLCSYQNSRFPKW